MSAEQNTNKLRDFILSEIRRRDISQAKFAEEIGVSESTLSRVLNMTSETTYSPSIGFLYKLSKHTSVPLSNIIQWLYPDVEASITPEIRMLSQRIQSLPPDVRRVVDQMIMGLLLEGGNKPNQ